MFLRTLMIKGKNKSRHTSPRHALARNSRPAFFPAAFFLAASLLGLTGCGWAPIYATHNNANEGVATTLSQVYIENIPDREGQILRNHLIDRMHFSTSPQSITHYSLSVALNGYVTDLGILENATASRQEWHQSADFTLVDSTGHKLVTGKAISSVGYSKLTAEYGALTAQRSAKERALKEIGEQIVNRISLYFATGH